MPFDNNFLLLKKERRTATGNKSRRLVAGNINDRERHRGVTISFSSSEYGNLYNVAHESNNAGPVSSKSIHAIPVQENYYSIQEAFSWMLTTSSSMTINFNDSGHYPVLATISGQYKITVINNGIELDKTSTSEPIQIILKRL